MCAGLIRETKDMLETAVAGRWVPGEQGTPGCYTLPDGAEKSADV